MLKEKRLVPQLRFTEFKDKWNKRELSKLGEYIGGGTPDSTNLRLWEGSIPWISSSDVSDESIHKIKKTRFISEEAVKNSATKIIPKGSVLMVSRVGIGKFAVSDEDLCTSQDFTNLISNENEFFIAYYFKARSNRFVKLSQGTSIKGFTTKDIKSAKFAFPKKEEQQKIANFLSAIDNRIQTLVKKKTLLEQYKKGVMQKLFKQELRFKDDTSTSLSTSDGKAFPEWEEKKLGEVCSKKSSNISANKIEENFGEYIIYGASGVLKKVDFYKEENDYVSIIKDGAGVGRIVYCKGKSSVLGTMEIIKPNSKLNTYFLYCLLENVNFKKYITGSTIPHIYFKDYKKEKCNIPPLEEQTKIANFLSTIDKNIELVTKKIEHTKTYKKGLLQQMFV